MLIHLVGPGGVGKTTTGRALAASLSLPFVDLDEHYLETRSIERDIDSRGYTFYARTNVELYRSLVDSYTAGVVALSSGFMLYPPSVHPEVAGIHRDLLASPTTVLLMPSFDLEDCVEETIRRQLSKPYMKSSAVEQEAKIRERFPLYLPMGSIRVTTDKPVSQVVDAIRLALAQVKA